jgi:hypothetical protein
MVAGEIASAGGREPSPLHDALPAKLRLAAAATGMCPDDVMAHCAVQVHLERLAHGINVIDVMVAMLGFLFFGSHGDLVGSLCCFTLNQFL